MNGCGGESQSPSREGINAQISTLARNMSGLKLVKCMSKGDKINSQPTL